jgi:hypothetical protein
MVQRVQLTIDVLSLVPVQGANREFSVGGFRGAVTARQIVDDQTEDMIAWHILKSRLNTVNVGDGVAVRSVSRGYLASLPGTTYAHRKVPISATFKAF